MSNTNSTSGDGFVPDVEKIGGRFHACTTFQPSQYIPGSGYWDITVTDTQTGDSLSSTAYEANSIQKICDGLARSILAGHKAELDGPKGWAFDVPESVEEASDTDTRVYEAAEGEG